MRRYKYDPDRDTFTRIDIDAEPNAETEETTTHAWIMNKDIYGYVKTWWTENGVIGVTFVNGNTYITGANNVLIKEAKG